MANNRKRGRPKGITIPYKKEEDRRVQITISVAPENHALIEKLAERPNIRSLGRAVDVLAETWREVNG
jgi:hypothetical protein